MSRFFQVSENYDWFLIEIVYFLQLVYNRKFFEVLKLNEFYCLKTGTKKTFIELYVLNCHHRSTRYGILTGRGSASMTQFFGLCENCEPGNVDHKKCEPREKIPKFQTNPNSQNMALTVRIDPVFETKNFRSPITTLVL